MAAYNKIADWVSYMTKAANVATDQFAVALSNTAPGSEGTPPTGDGAGVIANVTQVGYGFCSARAITTTSANQAGGTLSVVLQDLTLTAGGGAVGPFRYAYVYDDTIAGDPLVCYYDYGSNITLADGETFKLDFAATFFTLA